MAETGRWLWLPEVAASEASVVATASCWCWCWCWCWCSWDSSALRFRGAGRRTSRKGQDGAWASAAVRGLHRFGGDGGPSRAESAMVGGPAGSELLRSLVGRSSSGDSRRFVVDWSLARGASCRLDPVGGRSGADSRALGGPAGLNRPWSEAQPGRSCSGAWSRSHRRAILGVWSWTGAFPGVRAADSTRLGVGEVRIRGRWGAQPG